MKIAFTLLMTAAGFLGVTLGLTLLSTQLPSIPLYMAVALELFVSCIAFVFARFIWREEL